MRQSRRFCLSVIWLASFPTLSVATLPELPARESPLESLLWESPLDSLLTRQWTREDGLPGNVLVDLLQTSDGVLWIATFSGLGRFDGQRLEIFDQDRIGAEGPPGWTPSTGSFWALAEDAAGTLWIGSRDGLLRRRHGRFQPFLPDTVRGTVRRIFFDRRGRLWIGMNTGVWRCGASTLSPPRASRGRG